MNVTHDIPKTNCVFLKEHDGYCRYMYDEILYIDASGSYCNVNTTVEKSKKITLAITLAEIHEFLPSDTFIRIHRSFIVNINHIERIIGNIIYVGKNALPIGRDHKKEVMSYLNIVG